MNHQGLNTIAILGTDTVVDNALAQLLEGEGYATRVIKTSPLREDTLEEEMPSLLGGGGEDLVVLAPSLSTGACDAFLAARRRASSSAPIPVIVLCSPMREAPALLEEEEEEQAARSVAWPTTAENLRHEIEDVLLEASAHRRTQSAS